MGTEEGVGLSDGGECTPVPPILLPVCVGFMSDAKGCRFPRRQASTCKHIAWGGGYSTQDLDYGNGKCELKYLVRFDEVEKYLPEKKARKMMSAMVLPSPAT